MVTQSDSVPADPTAPNAVSNRSNHARSDVIHALPARAGPAARSLQAAKKSRNRIGAEARTDIPVAPVAFAHRLDERRELRY